MNPDRMAVSRSVRWTVCTVLAVALVGIMLASTASWIMRVAVIVSGLAFIVGMNAYWRDYGAPRDGTP
jgi:hypothetical protein